MGGESVGALGAVVFITGPGVPREGAAVGDGIGRAGVAGVGSGWAVVAGAGELGARTWVACVGDWGGWADGAGGNGCRTGRVGLVAGPADA